MTDKLVPFTNNQGENNIRMTKVQQKMLSVFPGIFCRVRSYLSTCRKHNLAPTDANAGRLPDFIKQLE